VLHESSAQRIGALIIASESAALLNAYDAAPSRPRRIRAIACSVLFLWFALHAATVTGSLATSAPVSPRQDGSNQEVHGMQHKKRFVATAGAVALSLAGASAAQDAVEWRVADGGNGHWYGRSESVLNWDNARNWAVAHGGDLASITSDAERDAVLAIGTECWIGARKLPGMTWEWSDGTPWGYTMWCPGEPCCGDAGLYVHANSTGCWDDHNQARTSRLGLIEWSADCNNDGIVDFGQIRAGTLADVNLNNIPDTCESGGGTNAPQQWSVASGGNGHWYAAFATPKPIIWSEARDAAASQGGHLATLNSQAEDSFVSAIAIADATAWPLADRYGPWLGGYQTIASDNPHANWAWVTGEPWSYVSGLVQFDNSSRPDGQHDDYLHYIDHSAIWNDVREDGDIYYGIGIRSYLIEWSADCNSDGIVDFGQILAGELDDANHNNIPDCCEGAGSCNCPGDVARDGVVNGIDLAAVLNNWGTGGGAINADANGDGIVDAEDLALVLSNWGDCP